MRRLPHHPRHAGQRHGRSRPVGFRFPQMDRLDHGAEHHREPGRMDLQRAVDQARSPDATDRPRAARPQRHRRLPAEPGRMTLTSDKGTPEVHPDQAEHELLEVWEDPPGIPGFFATVDHKRLGIRYVYTSFAFFFIAGLVALVMRAQLTSPNSRILDPQTY